MSQNHPPNEELNKNEKDDIENQIVAAVKKMVSEQMGEQPGRGQIAVSLNFTPAEMNAEDVPVPTVLRRSTSTPGAFALNGPQMEMHQSSSEDERNASVPPPSPFDVPLVTATLVIEDHDTEQGLSVNTVPTTNAPTVVAHAEPMENAPSASRIGRKRKLVFYSALAAVFIITGLSLGIIMLLMDELGETGDSASDKQVLPPTTIASDSGDSSDENSGDELQASPPVAGGASSTPIPSSNTDGAAFRPSSTPLNGSPERDATSPRSTPATPSLPVATTPDEPSGTTQSTATSGNDDDHEKNRQNDKYEEESHKGEDGENEEGSQGEDGDSS